MTDEAQLLGRIRSGDVRAFETLYEAYHPRLSRFIGSLVFRPHLVQEVLNDTMMVVWRRADSLKDPDRLSSWIFGIAYRTARKAQRRDDAPVEDTSAETRPSEDADAEAAIDRRETEGLLLEAIAKLSPDHRAAINLTYYEELGYREIAAIMGCPVDTVKTRVFHARKHLRRFLTEALPEL